MADHLRSDEAEAALIGAILCHTPAYDAVAEIVSPEDFSSVANAVIFRAMGTLVEAGRGADVVAVAEHLRDSGTLGQVGGLEYLQACNNGAGMVSNVRRYAEIVRSRSLVRSLRRIAGDVIEATDERGVDPHSLGARIESALIDVFDSEAGGPVLIGDALTPTMEWLDERSQNPGSLAGLGTGFVDFDRMTLGLSPGDLVIVGARPAMGKSTFGLNIASHMAGRYGPGIFFTLEMPVRQLVLRELSSGSGVSMQDMRSGEVNRDDWDKVSRVCERLAQLPLYIDERTGLSPHQVRSAARRIKRAKGLKFIVVDYIGLMRGDGENRNQQMGDVSRSLKSLAKELGIAVIALAQLNRALEARSDKRPGLADLRDSGEVEQDADIVAFLHREEYYKPDDPVWRGIAELLIRKQRNGPTGDVQLAFDGAHVRFANLERSATVRRDPVTATQPGARKTFDD